ncbi:MAG: pyruvate dehydrogenase (acetyl-transferring) E1 component subunit alpha [Salegentibacter sp.]|uniref:pyruvate dehydrogenase (acetyl-transferring) E1 component subunit alpha n=1 Tax=Salegentibacter sp. TaxID=1903072 RepID=UPI002870331F|nr:pyruvate dehydrogenase (acetyl-transferring) E1 component subunit alpha [Salegentibacter sp.]MDR9458357.1 pyruvate dehydrogenase (acetyl-transferring) E1 component subunit alpha [Salegentibacter sp.]
METKDKLSPEKAEKLLYQLLLMRKFEEKSAELYTKEKIRGFLHLYIGEEAVATGVIQALKPEDNVLGTYREHAHALARDVDAGAIMAEMYGKQEGCSRGRGGSMHIFDKEKNFFGGSAIVGGHLPLATGMALASKKLKKDNITVCFFGEGAAAEGIFHEALNLASLWKVPVLFVCENNLYAMGTALRFSHAVQEIEKKGQAYGIESKAVDGMDLLKVMAAANKAVEQVRNSGEPYLLVCNTYRFRAHSMFDAELYRKKSEVEKWKKRDPIPKFRKYLLKENLISETQLQEMEERLETEIQKAVDFAEAGTWEAKEELTRFVYSENPES